MRRLSLLARVKARCLISPTGCWIWHGSHSGIGRGGWYGRISIDGFTMAVHRVVWQIIHGPISSKRQIDHVCGIRLCCNPDHLEAVTHKENQKRRAERV